MYQNRFGLRGHPLPKDAQGSTFYTETGGYERLSRAFETLRTDRGLGVLTGTAGVGKTAAIRNLCRALPRPDHRVLYLCDTAVAPLDMLLPRTLIDGAARSLSDGHRRARPTPAESAMAIT